MKGRNLFLTALSLGLVLSGCDFKMFGPKNQTEQNEGTKEKVTINVINGNGSGTYDKGATVTLSASNQQGFSFIGWKKDDQIVSTSLTYTFVANENATFVAEFTKNETPKTVNIIVDGGTGSGSYLVGTSVTIVAQAQQGKTFVGWMLNESVISTELSYTFVATENASFVAKFEENKNPYVPTKFVAISDVHVIPTDSTPGQHLKKTLEYTKANNVDVILFNGDSISYGDGESYALLDGIISEVYGSVSAQERPEFLFNMGNHEFYPNSSCRHEDTDYDREVGSFRTFANKWMSSPIEDNIYYRLINNVNYVIACPGKEQKDGNNYLAANGAYSDNDLAKLKSALDKASKNSYPIVLGTHHPWGYTYGGKSYRVPGEPLLGKMRTLLANYPNIINLTSHSHFSNLHERTFDQTDYTTINIGTHCYNKAVGGQEYDENDKLIQYLNVSENKYTDPISKAQDGKTHFGIGIDFNEECAVAKRINFAKGIDYAHGTWTIPYGITKENMHDKFLYEAGERVGENVDFKDTDILDAEVNVGVSSSNITVTFTDTDNYYAVEGYKVEIKGSTGLVDKTVWWQSMFWADLAKKSSYSFTIDNVKLDSEYNVSVYPMDFFGKYGNPISKHLSTSAERTDEEKLEEESGDLLYLSNISTSSFSKVGPTYFMDNKCFDVANVSSGYSLKLSCNSEGSGWPSIRFDLEKSYDFTKCAVSADVKFENTYPWFSIKAYDSTGNYVMGEPGYDAKSTNWSNAVFSNQNIKDHVRESKVLTDVRYLELVVNFDKNVGQNQAVYFDNLKISDTSTELVYETYNSSTTITFNEEIVNWKTSTKHLKFYTNTTSKFMFTLVNNGDRISSKVYFTLGDGTSPIVEGIKTGGYQITKNGSDFLVDIVVGQIIPNDSFVSISNAQKINFREGFPLNIANLVVE